MERLIKRLTEPSTYAGLAGIAAGIGAVGKVNEAETVATMISTNGPALGGMLAGLLAMFMGEKNNR